MEPRRDLPFPVREPFRILVEYVTDVGLIGSIHRTQDQDDTIVSSLCRNVVR